MTKNPNTQGRPKNPIPNSEHPSSWAVPCLGIPSCLGLSGFELPVAFISPGGGELIMIMLVLIMLFGAKDAPRILRTIQTLLDKLQRSAAEFRYKVMYGDMHHDTTDDEPYDVETDYPDEDVQSSELHIQGSEEKTNPDAENSEPGTENSELKT